MVESLSLASGASEDIAKPFSDMASSVVDSSCHAYSHFCEFAGSFIKVVHHRLEGLHWSPWNCGD